MERNPALSADLAPLRGLDPGEVGEAALREALVLARAPTIDVALRRQRDLRIAQRFARERIRGGSFDSLALAQ